jgi:hypothetical protein
MDQSRQSVPGLAGPHAILSQDPVKQRDTLHQMHLDMEGLEKRIQRVQKAARVMHKAYKGMYEASQQFQEALLPFSEGREDSIVRAFSQALSNVRSMVLCDAPDSV